MKNFDSRTYSINDFLEWQVNNQLELNPKFQRRSVWSDRARSYLMDTIVRGKPSYLRAPTFEHANLAVIGTQKYVDWGNPDIVTRLASLYFPNGAPYKPALSAIISDLYDLRAVRNAAAHLPRPHRLNSMASLCGGWGIL